MAVILAQNEFDFEELDEICVIISRKIEGNVKWCVSSDWCAKEIVEILIGCVVCVVVVVGERGIVVVVVINVVVFDWNVGVFFDVVVELTIGVNFVFR